MTDTMLICDPRFTLLCTCSGELFDCQCRAKDRGADHTECTECGELMCRIEVDSGRRVDRDAPPVGA